MCVRINTNTRIHTSACVYVIYTHDVHTDTHKYACICCTSDGACHDALQLHFSSNHSLIQISSPLHLVIVVPLKTAEFFFLWGRSKWHACSLALPASARLPRIIKMCEVNVIIHLWIKEFAPSERRSTVIATLGTCWFAPDHAACCFFLKDSRAMNGVVPYL